MSDILMIYIVTSGSYSDYGILAAFTNHDAAVAFRDNWNIREDSAYFMAEIEEWPDGAPETIPAYFVQQDREGNLVTIEDRSGGVGAANRGYWNNNCFMCHLYARDEAQAIKTVNEYRTQSIARGELDEYLRKCEESERQIRRIRGSGDE